MKNPLLTSLTTLALFGSSANALVLSSNLEALPPYESLTGSCCRNPWSKSHFSSCQNYYCYRLNKIDANSYEIELQDGSIWHFNPKQAMEASRWGVQDRLIIEENNYVFSSQDYPYRVTNVSRGRYLEAVLKFGPFETSQYRRTIDGIDHSHGQVFLSDGSTWSVEKGQGKIFDQWKVGHTIIVGINNTWWTDYSTLLINVDKASYAHAKEF